METANMIRAVLLYATAGFVICDLCSKVLMIQCETQYQAAEAEGVCGTNDVSYVNFCYYSQAKCKDSTVDIKHVGLCRGNSGLDKNQTSNISTTTTSNRRNDSFNTVSLTTDSKMSSNNDTSSNLQIKTTLPAQTPKTTPSAVDYDPIHHIFCAGALAGTIRCTDELDPYCGTDGKFYLNSCEFEKARCHNSNLSKQPLEMCKEKIPTPAVND